jgi:hypothetical protein
MHELPQNRPCHQKLPHNSPILIMLQQPCRYFRRKSYQSSLTIYHSCAARLKRRKAATYGWEHNGLPGINSDTAETTWAPNHCRRDVYCTAIPPSIPPPNNSPTTRTCWYQPRPPSVKRTWQRIAHTRLPTQVPHEAAIPAVHRDAPQPVGRLCWYWILVSQGHPKEDPRWEDHTEWTDFETVTVSRTRSMII